MKKRFTEEQIIGFLREAEAGMPIVCIPVNLSSSPGVMSTYSIARERC